MAISKTLDVTADLNADGRVQVETGGWDYAVVQLVSPSTTVNFETTSDAGAVTGVSDGNAESATNWVSTQGTNLATGAAVTSLAASGQVRFEKVGQFLRLIGAGVTASQAFIRLYKIN